MAKLEQIITIQSPVDKVFAYISEPANQVEIWPSMVEVTDVKRLPDGGYTHGWVYKMAGVRLTLTKYGPLFRLCQFEPELPRFVIATGAVTTAKAAD